MKAKLSLGISGLLICFPVLKKDVHCAFGNFLSLTLVLCSLMSHIVFVVVIVLGLICLHFALVLGLVYGALCYILYLFLIPSWRPRSHFRTKIWWQRVASEKRKYQTWHECLRKKKSSKNPIYPKISQISENIQNVKPGGNCSS